MAVEVRKLLSFDNRVARVKSEFVSVYKTEPDFYVRVPGRVNLIGEHIDYCGYGVCPMALDQDIFLAVGIKKEVKTLTLHNLNEKFVDFEGPLDNILINLENSSPKWHQYFQCGVKGILETLSKNEIEKEVKGLSVIVSGTIPQSAGLSSSSALVSAAALATAYAFDLPLNKTELANICASCERYIGTQGGGMDQAIAFLASEGCAKLIEFNPLRSTDVKLPSGATFIVAHSIVELNKAATADFNCRVVECRLAAQVIAHKKGLDWTKIKSLGSLQIALKLSLDGMIAMTKDILQESPYSKEDVIRELNTTSSLVDTVSLTSNTRDVRSFKLYQRALHVFNEAQRVLKFQEVCQNLAGGEDTLSILGNLMRQSHDSLRDLYECSHPQLDRIVELAEGVTLGTRLTGAGWGGCTVSLVTSENVDKFICILKEKFYKPLGVTDGFESIIFRTAPRGGACIFRPHHVEI